MTTSPREELLAAFERQDRERAQQPHCASRKPLNEELQASPDGYLPEIDEHYPEHSERGVPSAAQRDAICQVWCLTTGGIHVRPRCRGCGQPAALLGRTDFGHLWGCERFPPIASDAVARPSPRDIDCGCDDDFRPLSATDAAYRDPEDGITNRPLVFWIFVGLGVAAGALLVLDELRWIGP